MRIWDRIVGGATRLANGEPIGSLLGLASPPANDGAHPGLRQIGFTIGVIALGAKMAGADGQVSDVEIEAFRNFFQVPPGEEKNVERFFDLAKRDVAVDAAEADYLAKVARIFGLSSARFERARAAALGIIECEPCIILGIDPLATDEQVREAWLRQVRDHHPDRLIAQGLPEEAIAVANRKLALINDAYDRLRRERGLVPALS